MRTFTRSHGCLCCDCLLADSRINCSLLHVECEPAVTVADTSQREVVVLPTALACYIQTALVVAHGLRHGDTFIFAPLSGFSCSVRPAGSISNGQFTLHIAG